jgi:hypothetical protein
MSTTKRKRNLLDFRQKREIVEIKNPTNNETWEAARQSPRCDVIDWHYDRGLNNSKLTV